MKQASRRLEPPIHAHCRGWDQWGRERKRLCHWLALQCEQRLVRDINRRLPPVLGAWGSSNAILWQRLVP